MKLLIVAPSQREADALGPGALACGSGADAGASLDTYLMNHPADGVLVAGFCAGLDPSLSPGDLILARNVIAPGLPDLNPDAALFGLVRRALQGSGLPFVSSQLLTVGRVAGRRREKLELWNRFGAGGVDMETSAIVQAAEAHHVRWLALRAVLDLAMQDLPAPVRRWRNAADEPRIARSLAMSPFEWPAAARLAWQMRRALAALRQAIPVVSAAASSLVDLEVSPPAR